MIEQKTNINTFEKLTSFAAVVAVKPFFSMTFTATFSQEPCVNASRTSPKAPLTIPHYNIQSTHLPSLQN